MTPEVIGVALIAGLAGGAVAALVMGSIQAWMARGRGWDVAYARHVGPPPTVTRRAAGSPAMGPFDRFDPSGKRVFALAQDEAVRQDHNYIGTEHLLAALLRDDTVAARALAACGIELTKVRTAIEFTIGRGDQKISPSEITLSPRTKKVIDLAIDESRRMGQSYVGAEHILLGVIREGEGIASGVIESLGVSLPTLRMKVIQLLERPASKRHRRGPSRRCRMPKGRGRSTDSPTAPSESSRSRRTRRSAWGTPTSDPSICSSALPVWPIPLKQILR